MTDTKSDHSPHIRALLAAARAEGKAEGRREEREATLGYLWRSDHPRLHAAAGQIEANQHVDLDGRTLFAVTLDNARAEGEAAGYRRALTDACAALKRRLDQNAWHGMEAEYDAAWVDALTDAEAEVRTLVPLEPVSKADELPAGAKDGTP